MFIAHNGKYYDVEVTYHAYPAVERGQLEIEITNCTIYDEDNYIVTDQVFEDIQVVIAEECAEEYTYHRRDCREWDA